MNTNLSLWFKHLPFGTLNKIFGIDLNVMPDDEVQETLSNCGTFFDSLTVEKQREIYTNYDFATVMANGVSEQFGGWVNSIG